MIEQVTAALVATAQLLTVPALVVPQGTVQTAAAATEAAQAQPPAAQPSSGNTVQIGFSGLEARMRAHNPTILSFAQTLQSIEKTDIDDKIDRQILQYAMQGQQYSAQIAGYEQTIASLKEQLAMADPAVQPAITAQITALSASLAVAQQSAAALELTIKAVDDDGRTDAKDELTDAYTSTKITLEQTTGQMIMGAENAYLGLFTLRDTLSAVDRGLAALERNLAVVRTQVAQGMASQSTLDALEQTRRATEAQRQTLVQQEQSVKRQLSLLLGYDTDTEVETMGEVGVTQSELLEMQYERDLAQALENNFSILSAKETVRKAKLDYDTDFPETVPALEAAKLQQTAAEQSAATSFRSLFDAVGEKNRLLQQAQAEYDSERQTYARTKVQYEQGMISRLNYEAAGDTLAEKRDAVTTAEQALFSAYRAYVWAKRGIMSSAG